MRKVAEKKAKLNNAGMTLVEILIAIAILAVAIIPLMYAFVSSMRYNARGRELQQTTALAHTIIENCKADTLEEVTSAITAGTLVPGGYTAYDDGNTYYMQNVKLENQLYDVKIDFTSHDIGGTTSYDILRSTTMNPYLDAMLTVNTPMNPTLGPSDPGYMTPALMDSEAYITALEALSAAIKNASTSNANLNAKGIEVDLSTSFIEDTFKTGGSHAGLFELRRNVAIYISQDVTTGFDSVKVIYSYVYDVAGGTYSYRYEDATLGIDETLTVAADDVAYASYTYDIYSNSDTLSQGAKLENIYIMYYPPYSKTNAAAMYPFADTEQITIYNNLLDDASGDREVNLYLVKQKNSNYTDDQMLVMDVDYAYKVQVTASSTTGAKTNLYHNIDYNLGADAVISGWAPGLTWNGVELKSSMITKENKTLMYDFVVQIYKPGAIKVTGSTPSIDTNAKLIFTMDGTDLDW